MCWKDYDRRDTCLRIARDAVMKLEQVAEEANCAANSARDRLTVRELEIREEAELGASRD